MEGNFILPYFLIKENARFLLKVAAVFSVYAGTLHSFLNVIVLTLNIEHTIYHHSWWFRKRQQHSAGTTETIQSFAKSKKTHLLYVVLKLYAYKGNVL